MPHVLLLVLLDRLAAEDHVVLLEEYAVTKHVVLPINSAKTGIVLLAIRFAIQTRHAVMEHALDGNVENAQMHVLLLQ